MRDDLSTALQKYSNLEVPTFEFVLLFLATAIIAQLLAFQYRKYATSLSDKKAFSGNFIMLATTTMLIITIVKSSLALSLGLVGALSIVRFRAAIKEPEELAYLFFAIAVGLGMGAGKVKVTVLGFVMASVVLYARHSRRGVNEKTNYFLTVMHQSPESLPLPALMEILKKHCSYINLKRVDQSGTEMEASFEINVKGHNEFEGLRSEIIGRDKGARITFLDQQGVAY